jgi:hypothetical protein
MTVDGQPIAPAYVVITNHTFRQRGRTGQPCFGFMQTIKMEDYPFGGFWRSKPRLTATISTATFSGSWAWKTASTVPTTFDGSPPELLDSDGKPQRTVKIGDMIEVLDMTENRPRNSGRNQFMGRR